MTDLDLISELTESFLSRLRRGERPDIDSYAKRHPQLATQIRSALSALAVLEQCGFVSDASRLEGPRLLSGVDGRPEQVGAYQILHEIGRGGMAIVYEAEHLALRRRVALKVLPGLLASNPTSLERFRREAQAAARLHHTNIVPVFEVGEQDGTWFYAMQLIPGQGLDQILAELRRVRALSADAPTPQVTGLAQALVTGDAGANVPLLDTGASGAEPTSGSTPRSLPGGTELSETGVQRKPYYRSVARIGIQVARALGYAHRHGIVHRDVKPSNLLLDTSATVWVADFGLAKAEGDELTHTGDIVGTLRYMAPERFQGNSAIASDIYSLGATLYELLALRPPFDDTDRLKLIHRITHDEPVALRRLDADIPRDLQIIVHKAMAKEPGRRYASADDLADDLERFLGDEPIRARQVSSLERLLRWRRRNPALALLVVCLFVTLLVGAAVSTWQAIRATRALTAEAQARQRAHEAIDTLTDEALQHLLGRQVQLSERERQFLHKVRRWYEEFAAEHGDSEQARRARAEGLYRLARIQDWLGESSEAERNGQAAVAQFRQLNTDFPANEDYRWRLARSLNQAGILVARLGRPAEAQRLHGEAIVVGAWLAQRFPERPEFRQELVRGHGCRARARLEEIRINPDCQEDIDRAVSLGEQLVEQFPQTAVYRQELVENLITRAWIERHLRGNAVGLATYRAALPLQQQLVRDFPENVEHHRQEAEIHRYIGTLLDHTGDPKDAEQAFRAALAIQTRLAAEYPTIPQYRLDLAFTYNNLGRRLFYSNPRQAEQHFREATKLRRRLADDFPKVPRYQEDLAQSCRRLSEVLGMQKRWAEALPLASEALQLRRQLAEGKPADSLEVDEIVSFQLHLAGVTLQNGAPSAAGRLLEPIRATLSKLRENRPQDGWVARDARLAAYLAALVAEAAGDHAAAVACAEESARDEPGKKRSASLDDDVRDVCVMARGIRLAEKDVGLTPTQRAQRCRDYAERAMKILRQTVERGFKDVKKLRDEPDLAPLRARADYGRLVAGLAARGMR